jgi:CBS domain-containing protein
MEEALSGRLPEKGVAMQVQDVMAREVIQCGPNDSIMLAAQRMRDRNVGCVVIAERRAVQGIVSNRDAVWRTRRTLRLPFQRA